MIFHTYMLVRMTGIVRFLRAATLRRREASAVCVSVSFMALKLHFYAQDTTDNVPLSAPPTSSYAKESKNPRSMLYTPSLALLQSFSFLLLCGLS